MVRVKVSEATGPVLDWMVAKAEGYTAEWDDSNFWLEHPTRAPCWLFHTFEPSTNWAQGGPIIEREGILLRPLRRPGHSMDGQWLAMFDGENTGTMVQWVKRTDWHRHYWSGPTPLIAAMRCFVSSKLDDEVETPEGFNHG